MKVDPIDLLGRLADVVSDGHFTVMKFTSNWRVALETPDLDTGDGREAIKKWATGATLDEAVSELLMRLPRRLIKEA